MDSDVSLLWSCILCAVDGTTAADAGADAGADADADAGADAGAGSSESEEPDPKPPDCCGKQEVAKARETAHAEAAARPPAEAEV